MLWNDNEEAENGRSECEEDEDMKMDPPIRGTSLEVDKYIFSLQMCFYLGIASD
jgi:hypothetical protein